MKNRKRVALALFAFAGVLLLIAAYTVWDNQRVVLVRQEVAIRDLPLEFEGFTILQISDLHGKTFGENQASLAALINRTEYDMLAITGDMADGYTEVRDNLPFFDLLDSIENKEHAFFTSGNTGPWGLWLYAGGLTAGVLTTEGEALEARGVRNLNQVYSIRRGESRIWVGEFWLIESIKLFDIGFSEQMLADPALPPEEARRYQDAIAYGQRLIGQLEAVGPDDTLIGLTHHPFSIDSASDMPAIDPAYDLVIAGHYHGGQIRVPFAGALYIPDAASSTRGLFPPEDRVSGLKDWGAFQQYISRGLGASSSLPFLNFRLFNTPGINLITLRRE